MSSGPSSAREHPISGPSSAREHPPSGLSMARDHHAGPGSAPLSGIHSPSSIDFQRSPVERKESPDRKRPILPSRLGVDEWDREAKRPRHEDEGRHLPAVHHSSAPNSAASNGPPVLARRSSIPGQERYPLPPPTPYWQSSYPPGYRPPPRPYAPVTDRHFPPPQSHYPPSGGYPPYDGRYHPGGPPADYRKAPPHYPGPPDKARIKIEEEVAEVLSSQNGTTNDDE
jgi:hypothetical protein